MLNGTKTISKINKKSLSLNSIKYITEISIGILIQSFEILFEFVLVLFGLQAALDPR